jgi:hypothetical protein
MIYPTKKVRTLYGSGGHLHKQVGGLNSGRGFARTRYQQYHAGGAKDASDCGRELLIAMSGDTD